MYSPEKSHIPDQSTRGASKRPRESFDDDYETTQEVTREDSGQLDNLPRTKLFTTAHSNGSHVTGSRRRTGSRAIDPEVAGVVVSRAISSDRRNRYFGDT